MKVVFLKNDVKRLDEEPRKILSEQKDDYLDYMKNEKESVIEKKFTFRKCKSFSASFESLSAKLFCNAFWRCCTWIIVNFDKYFSRRGGVKTDRIYRIWRRYIKRHCSRKASKTSNIKKTSLDNQSIRFFIGNFLSDSSVKEDPIPLKKTTKDVKIKTLSYKTEKHDNKFSLKLWRLITSTIGKNTKF